MNFREITEDEYRKFWEKSEQKCFLSAPEISHLNKKARVYFLAVEKDKKIISTLMVRGIKRRFSKYDYYAPRGIISYDKKVLKFLINNVKDFLSERGGYIFRIDPNVELVERDIDGNKVVNGNNNYKLIETLKAMGFSKSTFMKDVSQVTWEFILPIIDKTEDKILSDMKSSTRRCLKQALEMNIKVKELKREELNLFYDVLADTANRKNFSVREFEYYQKLYDLFTPRNEVQFVVATINPKKTMSVLKQKIKETKELEPKNKREQKDIEDKQKSLENRLNKIKNLFPGVPNKDIVLSSGVFMISDLEILYFSGGNETKYLSLNGQYILQWEMIKKAVGLGVERYNFYGIPANLEMDTNERGVYDFKRGFSGRCVELIGEWELPLSGYYFVNKNIAKLKRIIHK